MFRYIFIIFLFLSFFANDAIAQEICDNGIDDDNDGLIDLNDPECMCETLFPSSLIPNPSFEEKTCCPTENARLDCAVGWIQASNPTTDYIHTCEGYLGNTNIPAYAPLPLADGEGAVGFRDGEDWTGPNYKEYVGACLTETMEVGVKYRLDFYVGFRDNVPGSRSLNMAIFGSTDCGDLPFGNNSPTIGCPANTGNYTQLGEQYVSGSNEWVNVVFEFWALQPYEVIILGPSCEANPNYYQDPYFYVDRLVLAESSEFGIPFESVEGKICEGGITLRVPEETGSSYQWFKDGVAILGQTDPFIYIPAQNDVEGVYMCVISHEFGCNFSQAYEVRLPPYYGEIQDTICENDIYLFGSESLSLAGNYERTIEALDGCDSIIQLKLDVLPTSYSSKLDTFCEGDLYNFLDISTNTGGQFESQLLNNVGCDSIIQLDLTMIPSGIGFQLKDTIQLNLGDMVDLVPGNKVNGASGLTWLDQEGNVLHEGEILSDFKPTRNTWVYLEGMDSEGCPLLDSTQLIIRRKNYKLFIPNVFSPNQDNHNDIFNFYAPPSVESIKSFIIFDRWGNKVYEISNPPFQDRNWGWDGQFNGKNASVGVYAYMIEAVFIDGEEKVFSGDLSLLR